MPHLKAVVRAFASVVSFERAVFPSQSLGTKAARGALWIFSLAAINKLIALGSQLALAWLLMPQEFGLVAMAVSVANLASFVSSVNFRNLLIQNTYIFERDASQVFWLALTLNGLVAVLLMVTSPLAGMVFHEPQVVPLIMLAAVASPIQSLTTMYAAAVTRRLLFTRVALINFGAGLLQNSVAPILALLGFGAYSLIIPLIAMAAFVAAGYRVAAGPIKLEHPQPRRWTSLQAPLGWLMLASAFTTFHLHGTTFLTGLIEKNADVAGYYYWGYLVSMQIMFLLTTNLQSVLFPVLSRLNAEPQRQFAAIKDSCGTLMALAAFVCALQIVAAEPAINWLFANRWRSSIPVVQWLSFGFVTQPMGLVACSILLAQGRYALLAAITGSTALLVAASASIGAILGEHPEISQLVGIGMFCGNLFAGYAAFRQFGARWRSLVEMTGWPLLLLFTVILVGFCVGRLVAHWSPFFCLLAVGTASALVYCLLLKAALPHVARAFLARLRGTSAKSAETIP